MAEPSSLVEKLDQAFLECGICLDRFDQPRGLPCLHSFCHGCLEKVCDGKKEILCPNCKKTTTVPTEGVSGFPAHFMVNSLQETVDLEKLKIKHGPTDSTICGKCRESDRKVIVRCLDCNLFFCNYCHKSHDFFKPMKAHQVIPIKDIQAKKILVPLSTDKDKICENHDGEERRFYCETCSKPVCRDCIVMRQFCRDHDYLSLKDASKKQATSLMELTKQCEALKKGCKTVLQSTEKVIHDYEAALQEGKQKLETIKSEYRNQLEEAFRKYDSTMKQHEDQQSAELQQKKEDIQEMLTTFERVCDWSTNVTQIGSYFDITTVYPTLSTQLDELSKTNVPESPGKKMGHLQVEMPQKLAFPEMVIRMNSGDTGCKYTQKDKKWENIKEISTLPRMREPQGVSVTKDGKIAITTFHRYAVVLSEHGLACKLKCPYIKTFLNDIATTPYDDFVLPCDHKIVFFNSCGDEIKSCKTKSHDGKSFFIKTIAIDVKGRIVAGLSSHSIAIHNSDGKLLQSFKVPDEPRYLTVTPCEKIVASFERNSLMIMDYNGGNVQKVKPPTGSNWHPIGVCCSKDGHIFVVNGGCPRAVYQFMTNNFSSITCIITGLDSPKGIAISADSQKLYIAERFQSLIKVFRRSQPPQATASV